MATTDYASFLVRYWRATGGEQRIVIEHVQSGERVSVPSLGAVALRIAAWVGEASPERATEATGGADNPPDPP